MIIEGEIKKKIWFDNRELYRFFRDRKITELSKKHCIGSLPPYVITRDAIGSDERKKRIRLLASFMGNEYAQRLEYLHFSLERFLRTSMPINRLSSLISETFFYFERYMYMKVDWKKGESHFYRDHAFHPAGESFLGYELLKLKPRLASMFERFLTENNTITRYIFDNCRVGLTPENLEPLVYRTWFLASLFHDLGYVLNFYRTHRSQMLSFQRYSDLIFRSNRSSFDDIQLLLGNSLLFNTVDHKVLEDCYNQHRHGTFSAFLLLATFYSPPAFDGVDNIDRAAIELAARAIFFHDYPDEDGIFEVKNSKKQDARKKEDKEKDFEVFGDYAKRFKKLTRRNKGKQIFDNLNCYCTEAKRSRLHSLFQIDLNVKRTKKNNDFKSKRGAFETDPFAFYLRFIDELHVFGRNSLVTAVSADNNKSGSESPTSYEMPKIRNLVAFPAQLVSYNETTDKLDVFFCADDNLFSKKIDDVKNELFNSNYEGDDREWSKYFLNELFWLKQCGESSGMFNEIDFYFAGILPNKN